MKNQIFTEHRKQISGRWLIIGMLCAFCCTAFLGCSKKEADAVVVLSSEANAAEEEAEERETQAAADGEDGSSETEADEGTLVVYICGSVLHPAVYELPAGSRICDAVDAAGGMTEDAATDYWNLAELLSDGDMIYIPTKEEAAEREITEGKAVEHTGTDAEASAENDGKININSASAEELTAIPGIGDAKASLIVAYREEHGSFTDISEITNVSGIGDKLFENMKEMITVN